MAETFEANYPAGAGLHLTQPPAPPPNPYVGLPPAQPEASIPGYLRQGYEAGPSFLPQAGYASPQGNIPGDVPFSYPQGRCLPIQLQSLGGASTTQSNNPVLVPFPFVVRGVTVWAPPATPGANSDGKIALRVVNDSVNSAAVFATGQNLLGPLFPAGYLYCPTGITIAPLWVVWPEGHVYLMAQATSQGGATNVLLVAVVYVTPLADVYGVSNG